MVLLGSDIPGISPTIIEDAFSALGSHELVLGPACDGGFYCIGATRVPPTFLEVSIQSDVHCPMTSSHCSHSVHVTYYLLAVVGCLEKQQRRQRVAVSPMQGLTWSTDHVLLDTVRHAEQLGMSIAPPELLPPLRDIDTAEVQL